MKSYQDHHPKVVLHTFSLLKLVKFTSLAPYISQSRFAFLVKTEAKVERKTRLDMSNLDVSQEKSDESSRGILVGG